MADLDFLIKLILDDKQLQDAPRLAAIVGRRMERALSLDNVNVQDAARKGAQVGREFSQAVNAAVRSGVSVEGAFKRFSQTGVAGVSGQDSVRAARQLQLLSKQLGNPADSIKQLRQARRELQQFASSGNLDRGTRGRLTESGYNLPGNQASPLDKAQRRQLRDVEASLVREERDLAKVTQELFNARRKASITEISNLAGNRSGGSSAYDELAQKRKLDKIAAYSSLDFDQRNTLDGSRTRREQSKIYDELRKANRINANPEAARLAEEQRVRADDDRYRRQVNRGQAFGEISKEDFALIERNRAREERLAVQKELSSARRASAREGETPIRRAVNDFREGWIGASERPLTEMIGNTARISILFGAMYSVMFKFSQSMGVAIQGVLQYEDALADLQIVTDRTRQDTQSWSAALGRTAAEAGFDTGQGVAAGARAIGLYDRVGSSIADQQRISQLSTEVAARIAFLGGEADIEQTQQKLVGVQRSFGIADYDQRYVEDALAYVSKRSGRPATELLDAATEIGTLARDAGFTFEQTLSAVSRVTSTTGQSPQAVAGNLSQIFSKADDPAILKVLSGVGINTEGTTLAQQIQELADLQLSTPDQNRIIQKFGRGRSGQALGIILDQSNEINRLAQGATGADAGSGEEQFQRQIQAISMQLRLAGADFKQFASAVANTGAFDILVGGVAVLRETLQAVSATVNAFNELPRPLRTIAFVALELVAAGKLLRRGLTTQSAAQFIAGARSNAGVAATTGALTRSASLRAGNLSSLRNIDYTALRTSVAEGAKNGARAGIQATSRAGSYARGTLNANAGLIGLGLAAYGVNTVVQNRRADSQTQAQLEDLRTALLSGSALRSEELTQISARQADLRAQLEERQQYNGGLGFDTLYNLLPGSSTSQSLAALRDQERRAQELQTRRQELENLAKQRQGADKFAAPFDIESVDTALQQLSNSGATSAQQVQALSSALNDFENRARSTSLELKAGDAERFSDDTGRKSEDILSGLIDSDINNNEKRLQNVIPQIASFIDRITPDALVGDPTLLNNRFGDIDKGQVSSSVRGAIYGSLEQSGYDPSSPTSTLANGATERAAEAGYNAFIEALGEKAKELSEGERNLIKNQLKNQVGGIAPTNQQITAESGAQLLQRYTSLAQAAQAETMLETGDAVAAARSEVEALQSAYNSLSAAAARSDDDLGGVLRQARLNQIKAEIALTAAEVQRIQSELQLKLSTFRPDDKFGQAQATLQGLQDQLSVGGLTVEQRNGIQAQINQVTQQSRLDQFEAGLANALGNVDPRDNQRKLSVQLQYARQKLSLLTRGSAEWGQQYQQINDLQLQLNQSYVQTANAADAAGVDPSDQLANARLSIRQARRTMSSLLYGTEEYWGAYRQLVQAQQQLVSVQLDQMSVVDQLNSDLSDPVAQARNELQDAARRAANATNQGDLNTALVSQERARINVEESLFNQRLNDIQHRERMGQVTHEAYLEYLRNERSRLGSVTNKQRYQIEQLQRIDELLKAESEKFVGQFNLGDIRLPTPYEVRRQIGGAGAGGTNIVDNSVRNVQVNGASIEEVRQLLSDMLGDSNVLVNRRY